jgi:hypothetical protein
VTTYIIPLIVQPHASILGTPRTLGVGSELKGWAVMSKFVADCKYVAGWCWFWVKVVVLSCAVGCGGAPFTVAAMQTEDVVTVDAGPSVGSLGDSGQVAPLPDTGLPETALEQPTPEASTLGPTSKDGSSDAPPDVASPLPDAGQPEAAPPVKDAGSQWYMFQDGGWCMGGVVESTGQCVCPPQGGFTACAYGAGLVKCLPEGVSCQ